MECKLFANILYPLGASLLVGVIRYDDSKSIQGQVAAAGTDLAVLALGAAAGVINSAVLVKRWGVETTVTVGEGVALFGSVLVALCVIIGRSTKVREESKAKINIGIGTFALFGISAINVLACWWANGHL